MRKQQKNPHTFILTSLEPINTISSICWGLHKCGCLPLGYKARPGMQPCSAGNRNRRSGPQKLRAAEPVERVCCWSGCSSSSAGRLVATWRGSYTQDPNRTAKIHSSDVTDLVSFDAIHFLLHGRICFQHKKEDFKCCVQITIIWCHCN